MSTMPALPPNGASSTDRCGSVASVAQVVGAQVEESGRPRLAEQTLGKEAVDEGRKDGEDVNAHGLVSLRRPLRGEAVRAGVDAMVASKPL